MNIRQLAQGKGRYILESMGFPVEYMGKKHRDCPLCQAGKDRYRFTDYRGMGNFICSTCTPDGGDFVELAMQYLGYSFLEVVDYVNNLFGVEKIEYKPTQQDQERALNAKFLSEVSATTRKLTDNDPVTKYLNNRGIKIIPPTIRFLPEYKQDGVYHPCLIARLDNANGDRVSYKIIHLTQDGHKANVPIVKKTLPCEREMKGAAVRLFTHNGTLAVCEGIETALAHYQDTKIATWGLDNANNMESFECPKDVKHLIILPDMDASFVGQSAAYNLAKKASVLIGRSGYQLEKVDVNLLLRFQHDFEKLPDHGVKVDYLDYYNQQTIL